MAEGKLEHDWAMNSQVVAMIYNTHVSKKSDLLKPADFNPYAVQNRKKTKVGVDVLKEVFVKES